MEIKTTTDVKILEELKKYLVKPKSKVILVILAVASFLLSIAFILNKDYFLFGLFIFYGIFLFAQVKLIENRNYKIMASRLNEIKTSKKTEVICKMAEDGLKFTNNINENESTLVYDAIVKIVETENAIGIFTKAWQVIIFDKHSTNDKDKFLSSLKDKCKYAK